MTTVMILEGFSALWVASLAWFLVCNNRAFSQRDRLRVANRNLPPTQHDAFWRDYFKTTYTTHLWALFFFRDPRLLYGPFVQSLWERAQ